MASQGTEQVLAGLKIKPPLPAALARKGLGWAGLRLAPANCRRGNWQRRCKPTPGTSRTACLDLSTPSPKPDFVLPRRSQIWHGGHFQPAALYVASGPHGGIRKSDVFSKKQAEPRQRYKPDAGDQLPLQLTHPRSTFRTRL